MYYRKCNLCGFVTEIVDETTENCGDCKISFDPTFAEWKAKHPNKSFDDFRRKHCMNDQKYEGFKKRRKVLYAIGAVVFVLIYFGLRYYDHKNKKDIVAEIQNEYAKAAFKWEPQDIPELGVKFDAPFSMRPQTKELSEEQKQSVEWIKLYTYSNGTGHNEYSVALAMIKYKASIENNSVLTFFEGTVENTKKNPEISNLQYTVDTIQKSKFKSGILKETFYLGTNNMYSISKAYIHADAFWCFTFMQRIDNDSLDAISQQVIESILIEYKNEKSN